MRLAIALVALLAAATTLAADSTEKAVKGTGIYGTAGCGLGSLAFGDQKGAVQIFAATTNSIFGTQTFGMTSGTSNCGPSVFASGTKNFVEANREALAKDISRGTGESIGAIAVINACADSSKVGAALQKDFTAIFPSERASSDEVTAAILKTLHSDPALGCGRL